MLLSKDHPIITVMVARTRQTNYLMSTIVLKWLRKLRYEYMKKKCFSFFMLQLVTKIIRV